MIVSVQCLHPPMFNHNKLEVSHDVLGVQTPRAGMSTQSSLDSIMSYYTKETTPTKSVEGVKEDRESSLSKV